MAACGHFKNQQVDISVMNPAPKSTARYHPLLNGKRAHHDTVDGFYGSISKKVITFSKQMADGGHFENLTFL